jgi:hypothetical protein
MPPLSGPIEVAPISGARKAAAMALRAFGYLLGTALAAIYLDLVLTDPSFNWDHVKLRAAMIGVVGFPLGILFGTAWLLGWLVGRLDKKPPLG